MYYVIVTVSLAVIGIVFGIIAVIQIINLIHTVNREIRKEQHTSKSWTMVSIILFTVLAIICFWAGIGLFPSALKERDDKEYEQREIDRVVRVDGRPPIPRMPLDDDRFDPGVFGDQFGIVNSLFTGLALAGVVIAVLFQSLELKYQRAELANTRKVFMNTYHLQAVQTYMNSITDVTEKKNMLSDLLGSIRSMRESGEVDDYQLQPVRDRAIAEIKKQKILDAIDEVIIETSTNQKTDRAISLKEAISYIDQNNVGNGLLKTIYRTARLIVSMCESIDMNPSSVEQAKAKGEVNRYCEHLKEDVEYLLEHGVTRYTKSDKIVILRHQYSPFGWLERLFKSEEE